MSESEKSMPPSKNYYKQACEHTNEIAIFR